MTDPRAIEAVKPFAPMLGGAAGARWAVAVLAAADAAVPQVPVVVSGCNIRLHPECGALAAGRWKLTDCHIQLDPAVGPGEVVVSGEAVPQVPAEVADRLAEALGNLPLLLLVNYSGRGFYEPEVSEAHAALADYRAAKGER